MSTTPRTCSVPGRNTGEAAQVQRLMPYFARAAAVAMILLVLVALLVVPYLVHNARQEKNT